MERLLLIDGNNLAMRMAHSFFLSVNLTDFSKPFNPDDVMDLENNFPTGVLHGVFRSVIQLKTRFPDHFIAIIWDGGNDRRINITVPAVEAGVIPELYKFNRKKAPPKEPVLNFRRQKEELFSAISMTNIPQICVAHEEADDVIASYAAKYTERGIPVLVHTNDKDYYQLLSDNVSLLRGEDFRDVNWFRYEYGIEPERWVDVGALAGDTSDNIFSPPGWGETTSIKVIKTHKTLDGFYDHLHEKYKDLREKYPDLQDCSELRAIKTPSGKDKYPGVLDGMPYSGIVAETEGKNPDKVRVPKSDLMALMFEERARLALKLKAMVRDIELPDLPCWNRNMTAEFTQFCDKYSLKEVKAQAEAICSPQPMALPVQVVSKWPGEIDGE